MNIKEQLKKSIVGRSLKWILRAFLGWRFYFKQLFWSYKYYQTKRIANNCDIKCKIKYVGEKNIKFPHPIGIVIGMGVELGNDCIIFQNTTLGTKRLIYDQDYPKLGHNVIVGANSVIIGNVKIGNNVTIGAMTLVNKDIPDNAIAIGIPVRIIGFNKSKV